MSSDLAIALGIITALLAFGVITLMSIDSKLEQIIDTNFLPKEQVVCANPVQDGG